VLSQGVMGTEHFF